MASRYAMLIGNSEYEDNMLASLATPDADVEDLAALLDDPEIGGFDEVLPLVNATSAEVRRTIARFYAKRKRNDLLLLYFSGHGVVDDHGRLYLATRDTEHELLRGSAVPAAYITDEMDHSRSRSHALILDCCHSGAFAKGSKGAAGRSVGTANAFKGSGVGRVVLTATDATQYAWEGDEVHGEADNSVFTRHLIEGLKSGAADVDGDGIITVDELYEYVYEQVVSETPKQTPGKWAFKQQGDIVVARNVRPIAKPKPIPDDLKTALVNMSAPVRQGAVRELGNLLKLPDPALRMSVLAELGAMVDDDSRMVSTTAREILDQHGAANDASPVTKPPPPVAPRKPEPVVAPPPAVESPAAVDAPQSVTTPQVSRPPHVITLWQVARAAVVMLLGMLAAMLLF